MSYDRKKQQEEALAKATAVRMERREIKDGIKLGTVQCSAIAMNPIDSTKRMTLLQLLMSQDRWGRTRSLRFLSPLGLNAGKTLESLTTRQRDLLVNALRHIGN